MRTVVDFDKSTEGDLLPVTRGVTVFFLRQHHMLNFNLFMERLGDSVPYE